MIFCEKCKMLTEKSNMRNVSINSECSNKTFEFDYDLRLCLKCNDMFENLIQDFIINEKKVKLIDD